MDVKINKLKVDIPGRRWINVGERLLDIERGNNDRCPLNSIVFRCSEFAVGILIKKKKQLLHGILIGIRLSSILGEKISTLKVWKPLFQ